MSAPSLFKQCHFQERHLEIAVRQASMVWETFQRIEKTAKPSLPKQVEPEESNTSKQTAKRYANIILKYSDPTAIESAINAAFSNLDVKSLKNLKDYLHRNLQDKQTELQRAKPVLKLIKDNHDITVFDDAYIKISESTTSF